MKDSKKIVKPSIKKALDIVIQREEEERRVYACIKAEICPVCGNPITTIRHHTIYKDNDPTIWNRLFHSRSYDSYSFCSSNKEHYTHGVEYSQDYELY